MRRTASSLAVVLSALLIVAGSAGNKEKEAEKRQQEAEKSPQAAAYRVYVDAVRAKDIEAWKKAVPAKEADGLPSWCEMMKITPEQHIARLSGVPPDEIRFISLSVKENSATLLLVGKRKDGKKVSGEIILLLEGGVWKVEGQGFDN